MERRGRWARGSKGSEVQCPLPKKRAALVAWMCDARRIDILPINIDINRQEALMSLRVVSLGGSLISPREGGHNRGFLDGFIALVRELVAVGERYVIVCGGGALARTMQGLYRESVQEPRNDWLDRIGIAATRVHAHFIAACCSSFARTSVNSVAIGQRFTQRCIDVGADVIVSGGWVLGVSTDYVAVTLARELGVGEIINVSDMPYIYEEDPRINPDSNPLSRVGWKQFSTIIGDSWHPGQHLPFDPQALNDAARHNLRVLFVGADIENLRNALHGKSAQGTTICD